MTLPMTNISHKLLIAALLVLILPNLNYATEYYVHKSHVQASDNNDGTDINHPWKTIDKANQTLLPGDKVYIRKGIYQEVIDPHKSGSIGNKITYTSYQNEKVILEGNNKFPQGLCSTVYIGWTDWKHKSYITVKLP